jgi:transcriptional regulator with XRE-family HTH domain
MEPGVRTVSPIGGRLARWRGRRGLTPSDLAAASGIDLRLVDAVESGVDWVDRRSVLAGWAGALRLDPTDLTGQPYAPVGAGHVAVRAVVHRLRRTLAGDGPVVEPFEPDGVVELAELIRQADLRGDESALARDLPRAVAGVKQVASDTSGPLAERLKRAEIDVYVAASGLVRRLGYWDLAWSLLRRAAPGVPEPMEVRAERLRLLLDLGWPDQVTGCAERTRDGGAPMLSVALAHAMAGRTERACALLDARAADDGSAPGHAAVAVTRVSVAVEAEKWEHAAELIDAVERTALAPAEQVDFAIVASSVSARAGDTRRAANLLLEAHEEAPLRLSISPFARELLAVLPGRIADPGLAASLRAVGLS